MCHNYVICTIGPFHKPKTSLFISCKKNIRVKSTLTNPNHQLTALSFVTPVALHLRFNACKSSENSRNWVTIFTFLILTQRALSPLLYDIHARLWFEVHSYRSIDNKKHFTHNLWALPAAISQTDFFWLHLFIWKQ